MEVVDGDVIYEIKALSSSSMIATNMGDDSEPYHNVDPARCLFYMSIHCCV